MKKVMDGLQTAAESNILIMMFKHLRDKKNRYYVNENLEEFSQHFDRVTYFPAEQSCIFEENSA
jgi:hypothetical protein